MGVYTDKNSGRLYIQFRLDGENYKERLPKGISRKDAETLEIKIKSRMLFERHGMDTPRTNVTFERFVKDVYLPHVEANHSPDSFAKSIVVCRAASFLKTRQMRSIRPADIERFKQDRIKLPTLHDTPRKPATVLRELSILSKIFSLAVKNDMADYNPCSRVEKPRFDNVQDRILREEDEEKFFANMHSEWARDVCRMALYTGLRQNDIMCLTRFQVDLEQRTITIIQSKTKRRVVVTVNDVVIEILRRRLNDKLLFASPKSGTEKGSVRHAMIRACLRAEIPHITIRDLRRTFATRGLERGNDGVTVADALGHTSLRMIPRYVRSLENKRKLTDSLLDSPNSIPTSGLRLIKQGKKKT